jgi:cytochrome oxidase assembly protein ShyY1
MKSILKVILLLFCMLTTGLSGFALIYSYQVINYNNLNLSYLCYWYLITALILFGFAIYLVSKDKKNEFNN